MRIFLALLLALVAVPASAQTFLDPTQFVSLGIRISANVDKGFLGQVWDNSSPILKRISQRATFVTAMTQRRSTFGLVRSRDWVGISRMSVTNPKDGRPLGDYISVSYIASCNNPNGLHEQLLFFHDRDGLWRLAGYQMQ